MTNREKLAELIRSPQLSDAAIDELLSAAVALSHEGRTLYESVPRVRAMVDEGRAQVRRGEVVPGEEVFSRARQLIHNADIK